MRYFDTSAVLFSQSLAGQNYGQSTKETRMNFWSKKKKKEKIHVTLLIQTHRLQLYKDTCVFLFFLWLDCHGRIEGFCLHYASSNLISIKYSVDGWKNALDSNCLASWWIYLFSLFIQSLNSVVICIAATDFSVVPLEVLWEPGNLTANHSSCVIQVQIYKHRSVADTVTLPDFALTCKSDSALPTWTHPDTGARESGFVVQELWQNQDPLSCGLLAESECMTS